MVYYSYYMYTVFIRRKLTKLGFDLLFMYNDVCLGFQQSAVLLDDFITTESDVWGNKRKSRFRLDEPDSREKIKATLL